MATTGEAQATEEFEALRRRMFGIAYRMLGSAAEAEDIVQDAWLRWSAAERSEILSPGAWLAKVVTNLCLTRLDSARVRREQYVGQWLPEPVLTEGSADAFGPLDAAEQRESVSLALLVVLEKLTPVERAVFVLREAFAYGHAEIAGMLDLSEANSRQLYRRAKQAVAAERRRTEPAPEDWRGLVEGFLAAAREGDMARLEQLLTADVVAYSDGGGRVGAARRPILGRDNVARYFSGSLAKWAAGLDFVPYETNGGPGLLVLTGEQVLFVLALEVRDGRIAELRGVGNPEKLEFAQRQLSRS